MTAVAEPRVAPVSERQRLALAGLPADEPLLMAVQHRLLEAIEEVHRCARLFPPHDPSGFWWRASHARPASIDFGALGLTGFVCARPWLASAIESDAQERRTPARITRG